MMYLLLIGGLALLLLTGDFLVRGAAAIATRLGISPLIVGLTVIAVGTSAPELVVSVNAALKGFPGIALGNVIGSNVANVLLVLGLPAIIYPTLCNQPMVRRNTVAMLLSTALFAGICFTGEFGPGEGTLLIMLLALFLAYSTQSALSYRRDQRMGHEEPVNIEGLSGLPGRPWIISLYVLIGAIGLPVAANMIVEGASEIASTYGLSEAAIGATVIALGTSLPELATTMVCALRKHSDLGVGNVIGSNIFNILAIMGITAVVKTIPVPPEVLYLDLWFMVAAALIVAPFTLSRATMTRAWGIVYTLGYIAFLYLLVQYG